MSLAFNKSIAAANAIMARLKMRAEVVETPSSDTPWQHYSFRSAKFRKAQVDIVDARDTKNLWMMHVAVYPHINDSSPIYGFDIVSGPNKMSGVFHDISPAGDPKHYIIEHFSEIVKQESWNKQRELPDWAKAIFSPSIIAIGAVDTEEEMDKVIRIGISMLEYYIVHLGVTKFQGNDYSAFQNVYCKNQKLNPHTPRVLSSLGFSQDQIDTFLNDVMFKEI